MAVYGKSHGPTGAPGTSRLVHIHDVYRQIELNVYRVTGVGRVRNGATATNVRQPYDASQSLAATLRGGVAIQRPSPPRLGYQQLRGAAS